MRTLFFLVAVLLATTNLTGQDAAKAKMKTVFKGKNLKGWIVPNNNIWWTAENGILHCKSGPNLKGSTLWTKKRYKDFVVELDFLFGDGTIDTGIFMRGDGPNSPQIQIGISGSLKRDMTGSPYVPKQGYPKEATKSKEALKENDWNTIRAQAIGNVYNVWLNGVHVMAYTMEHPLLEGPVGLQLHGKTEMAVDFRNIRIGKVK